MNGKLKIFEIVARRFIFLAYVVLLSGCYCKSRFFEPDVIWTTVAEKWKVGFLVKDTEKCGNSDRCFCSVVFRIDEKFLEKDSLKNMSIHIDSLYLAVDNKIYKRVNSQIDFKRAMKANEKNPPELRDYMVSLDIVNWDSLKTREELPLIPRNVKNITVTAYVSFRHPDDDQVESFEIKKELHEENEVNWIRWWLFVH